MLARYLRPALPRKPVLYLMSPMPLYGINESSHWMIKFTIRRQEHEQRMAASNQQIEVAKRNLAFMQGALDELTYQMQTWGEDRIGMGMDPAIAAQMPRVRAAALLNHIADHPPPAAFVEAGKALDAEPTPKKKAKRKR